jgi:Family of unknown function (DUF5670)
VTTVTAPVGPRRYCRARRLDSADGLTAYSYPREAGRRRAFDSNPWEDVMLWTIFVILLVLWLLGVVSSYTLGGFIHVLLVVAVVIALIQLIQGRRVV